MTNSDTPSSESSPLDTNQAAEIFSQMLDVPEKEQPVAKAEAKEPEAAEPEAETEAEASEPELSEVTIQVDGKDVTLTKAQLEEAYKSGLRQSDYTRKTMETAEARKAADAERSKYVAERNNYAQNLAQQATLLQAVLQEQSSTDWQKLIDSDPVEYLKQRNLFEQRQTAYQRVQQEGYQIGQQQQAEAQQANAQRLESEQQALLAKLPDWKDSKKSAAEKAAIREVLKDIGYTDSEMNITDHRAILLAREALRYRQMVDSAKAAAKKVDTLPQRVVRPASGTTPSVDKRGSAFQRLSKTGRVEDAAAVFATFL